MDLVYVMRNVARGRFEAFSIAEKYILELYKVQVDKLSLQLIEIGPFGSQIDFLEPIFFLICKMHQIHFWPHFSWQTPEKLSIKFVPPARIDLK